MDDQHHQPVWPMLQGALDMTWNLICDAWDMAWKMVERPVLQTSGGARPHMTTNNANGVGLEGEILGDDVQST
ncbi:hypothetical protein P153DRAFT_290607 [Dothidotthia symphoricarpi CBS 119687]|uniref:Uncharacterized protein n=1 Tax=Dothidotthia symphoricarpi CBS 119687 TaxID=1392245 RepID=A0A6A6AE91_9PLEO|nr:uncharacterized protein P153DRAFT_290607 [Dothidotthia symphoricarpi CBS 119687]KAF2129227.1 hypothetical protein P153DRAFT_290607 [Dothidotthia symphoricarpi CBS 119687]